MTKIDVHHITRVEGHGNIKVDINKGKILMCRLEIVEAPRFFEAMLRGRHYDETIIVSSRICGICSVGHQLAALRAIEDAFNVKISEQEKCLRRLLNCGEFFESHVLHIYFLAVPDFKGIKSVFPLAKTHKDVVVHAIHLKRFGHYIGGVVGRWVIHSTTTDVKAMSKLPTKKELEEVLKRLHEAKEELKQGVSILKGLKFPAFERETEYISLQKKGFYTLLEGNIYSSDVGEISYKNYRNVVNEYIVDYATAKRAKHNRVSYMVGALARFNNNGQWLSDDAKQIARDLGLKSPCYNSYLNTVAQFVELVHVADDSIAAAESLLNMNLKLEERSVVVTPGSGVGAVEVPRGTLYHEYIFNDKGIVQDANCVIPTGQNVNNIEEDFKALLPGISKKSQKEITLLLEMLVRAYDPCISCSAHMLDVEFV